MGKKSSDKPAAGTAPATPPAAAPTAAPASAWDAYIIPFAQAIGKTPADVANNLKPLVGEPGEAAIALLQNDEDTPNSDVTDALKGLGVPKAVLTKSIKMLRKAAPVMAAAASPALYDVLPGVPDDESFLEMLKTGGVLKVGDTEVISAIRAALANRLGLYDLPSTIVDRMKNFAESQEEPVGPEYYALRKLLTRRGTYSEIFVALGLDQNSVPEKDKTALLSKLDAILWTSLQRFNEQVKGWVTSWQSGMANPGIMMAAIASMAAGGRGGLPAGMMQPPDTMILRKGAEGVIDRINKVFAGTGIVTARALAFDAGNIRKILENPTLPAQLGSTNREQMLKSLGINVSSDLVVLEQTTTRFALAVMKFPTVEAGDREITYLSAMFNLGNSIPWDMLMTGDSKTRRADNRL